MNKPNYKQALELGLARARAGGKKMIEYRYLDRAGNAVVLFAEDDDAGQAVREDELAERGWERLSMCHWDTDATSLEMQARALSMRALTSLWEVDTLKLLTDELNKRLNAGRRIARRTLREAIDAAITAIQVQRAKHVYARPESAGVYAPAAEPLRPNQLVALDRDGRLVPAHTLMPYLSGVRRY